MGRRSAEILADQNPHDPPSHRPAQAPRPRRRRMPGRRLSGRAHDPSGVASTRWMAGMSSELHDELKAPPRAGSPTSGNGVSAQRSRDIQPRTPRRQRDLRPRIRPSSSAGHGARYRSARSSPMPRLKTRPRPGRGRGRAHRTAGRCQTGLVTTVADHHEGFGEIRPACRTDSGSPPWLLDRPDLVGLIGMAGEVTVERADGAERRPLRWRRSAPDWHRDEQRSTSTARQTPS